MTLREFLLKNAPRDEIQRRRWRDDWIAAVDKLLAQLRAWLSEAGSAELLDLEPLHFERREQGLGAYDIQGLAIHFGERTVKVVPVGRTVLAHLGPYAQPGHENAEGRVDITNGAYKYFLYRQLNDAGDEQWLVQDERSEIQPLDRERFEAILQDLLS
ncbi:MAG: hypothetical protein E6K70_09980 [Planctomycetota bacterium]|nr:MAG: hypothetical protein E6K70_09980 [Planctomycetota bacterium]